MSHVMPEVILRRILQIGIAELRQGDRANFDHIFETYRQPELAQVFGQSYIDKIYKWFTEVKLPVVMAWSFSPDRIPSYSVHLASETEDESKAAAGDFRGGGGFDVIGGNDTNEEQNFEQSVGVFTVMLDIGVHANRAADDVLWMYYILNFLLFKKKRILERMGIELQTFSASDYNRDQKYMGDNIWTRWVRFRCTVQNTYRGLEVIEPEGVEVDVDIESVSVKIDE